MIFQFQLTPLTLLVPLAVLLGCVAWMATKDEKGGPFCAVYVLAVWGGALLVWLLAAVALLGFYYFTHSPNAQN